jgi:CHAD domain-containing protein
MDFWTVLDGIGSRVVGYSHRQPSAVGEWPLMFVPVRDSLEREIKLHVGPGFALPELPGRRFPPRLFTSTYYDTAEYGLAQRGITLRYRQEGRTGAWQLKLPANGARRELEFAGGRNAPPASLSALLLAHLRGKPLKPIARLRTHRVGKEVLGSEGPLAEVVVDDVSVLNGRKTLKRFTEVEVEQAGGDDQDLRRIEKALRKAGAEPGDQRPKLFQALDLAWPGPGKPVPAQAPPVAHLRALLQAQVAQILRHDPGVRLGTYIEDVHQMRVATRRFRAILRAARPMLAADWAETLRSELAWLGGALGPVRDLDVFLDHLGRECAMLPAGERRTCARWLEAFTRERTERHGALLEALTSERYLALLARIELTAASPVVTDATVRLSDIARAAFEQLRRAVRVGRRPPSDDRLHRIRIIGKRARYAAELAEATIGKLATRYIRRLRDLQDLLGEHHDALVAEQRLRQLLAQTTRPRAAFALGRLIERQSERRRAVRAKLPELWAKVERRGRETWE